jgi:hypothetical protein
MSGIQINLARLSLVIVAAILLKHANPPIEWNETKNIRWKVEIPGRGFASPVVWGERIFVLSAVPVGVSSPADHGPRGLVQPRDIHRFNVIALDRHGRQAAMAERSRRQTDALCSSAREARPSCMGIAS